MSKTLQLMPICHGNWAEVGQSCSLPDLLFSTHFAAQIFDWQNAVFLLFMPLMLGVATLVFHATFRSSGDVKLASIFKKAGDMHQSFENWGTMKMLPIEQVSGGNMGQHDEVEEEYPEIDTIVAPTVEDLQVAPIKGDLEMASMKRPSDGGNTSLEHVTVTSTHPTDIDPRNLAVMISLSAFIISTGMVCWAAISDFVDVSDLDVYKSKGIYAQGFATQTLQEGVKQRGINIGWGVCWLGIGAILMTVAQLIIRKVIIGPNLDVVEAVLQKGNVAAAISRQACK